MLQGSEIIIILLVALVVLGPKRLPEVARKLGNWSAELRRAARDFRVGLDAEVADLKQVGDELRKPIGDAKDAVRDVGRDVDRATGDLRRLDWVGPDPVAGPTSADALEDLAEIEGRQEDTPSDEPEP